MKSAFVIVTQLIISNLLFEKIVCNNFGRAGIINWQFPALVVSNKLVVCIFYAEALFCALLRLCVLLRSFADLRLRAFAHFCVRPRLERPGVSELQNTFDSSEVCAKSHSVLEAPSKLDRITSSR